LEKEKERRREKLEIVFRAWEIKQKLNDNIAKEHFFSPYYTTSASFHYNEVN
jgi:hypothetical protein